MNEQENVFQSVMESEPVQRRYSSHSTNSLAEIVINVLAILWLIVGLLASIAFFALAAKEEPEALFMFLGIFSIIISLIQWAFVKIFVNISRNLFNINEFLRERFGDKEA
ncbi:MAG: hypothetical protein K2K30_07215 [Alistipes sp.]|nr:hypothetical protein [Alistipes sp.]